MPAILHLNLHQEFFAQIVAVAAAREVRRVRVEVLLPGIPKNYPDPKEFVTEDCIRPQHL